MNHPFPYSIKQHGTTLEKCEHEPVQTPGCIQSHGVLLVLRKSDLTILQVSENSESFLGYSPDQLLSQNVALAVGEHIARQVQDTLAEEWLDKSPFYLNTIRASESKSGRPLHVSLHTHAGLALLELENTGADEQPPPHGAGITPDYYGLVRKTLSRFQKAPSLKELSQSITEEVRRITQMDRVMVYHFHPDNSGEIIAEAKREDQGSWMGWRYPEHDIPRPAREIFKKIWSRPVPDVRSELFEMVPLLNPDTQQPLDMTYCSLRGASTMYTEYLDNMEVRAALTLPLMREGELWGLIACHHNAPKLTSPQIRAACEFLARAASQQLTQVEDRENTQYRMALEAANYALISKVSLKLDLSAFTSGDVNLIQNLDCEGAAIFYQEDWSTVGKTPQPHELASLAQWFLTQPACEENSSSPILVTDHLSSLYPVAEAFTETASGLIAFAFSRSPLGLVFYFKPETLQTLTWAGDPNELPLISGPNGPRLSPRKSFEVWRETVSKHSLSWKTVEVEAVSKFRGLLIDLIVSRADQINALRAELQSNRAEAEKVMLEANERFRGAVNAGNLGTWDFTPSSGEFEWSDRCRDLYGISPTSPPDYATFLSAIHPDDRDKTDRLVQQALDPKGELKFETEYRTNSPKPESVKWLRATGKTTLNLSGQVDRFRGTVLDITEMVRARESLAERRDQLQLLVEQRTVELRNTIGELQAFSYSVSHDMRSPLRAMQGFAQALLDDYADKLDEYGKDYLHRIERGAKRLDLLIQDVLSYSSVANSEIKLRPVDLAPLLEELCSHHPEFQEPHAAIKIEGSLPVVLAHEAFLSQIFTNLIGNAVKFQMPGAKPEVIVSAEPSGNLVRIWIKDNGMGIDPSHHSQIFGIFGRVYPGKTYDGTGIGLAIVKKAVSRMGGEVGLNSALGQGSQFWFTLKLNET